MIPPPASVIAIPTTIWSRPSQTHSTIMTTEVTIPAPIPHRNPTQTDPA